MKKQPRNSRQIAYTWVLRREQAENSHALEQHLDRLEKAGVAPEDVFYDIESDVEVDRPEFKKAMKLQIHSLNQGYVDLDTSFSQLHAGLQALFSDHERDMLRERVSKGYSYRRQRQAVCPYPWAVKFSTSYTKEQIDRLLTSEQEQIEEERNEKTTS